MIGKQGFNAYGYPRELFKLDMERLGIAAKRKPAKVIDFAQYIENNRGTNDQYHKIFHCRNIAWRL